MSGGILKSRHVSMTFGGSSICGLDLSARMVFLVWSSRKAEE